MKKTIIATLLSVLFIAVFATGCRNNNDTGMQGVSETPAVTAAPVSNTAPARDRTIHEAASGQMREDASELRDMMYDKKENMKEAASDVAEGMRNAGKDLANGMKDAGRDLKDTMDMTDGTPGAGVVDSADEVREMTTRR